MSCVNGIAKKLNLFKKTASISLSLFCRISGAVGEWGRHLTFLCFVLTMPRASLISDSFGQAFLFSDPFNHKLVSLGRMAY